MARRILLAVTALLGIVAIAYLYAASTEGFRTWMGDRGMRSNDFPSAITWYSRALRVANPDELSPARRLVTQKLYKAYEGFCRWEFDGDQLWGWYAANQINLLKLQGGLLTVGATGDNPYLEIIKLRLSPRRAYHFRVRMRCRAGQQAQLYWAPATDIFSPKRQASFQIDTSGEWREYEVNIPPGPDELGKFRFCPANAQGLVDIDWIRILP